MNSTDSIAPHDPDTLYRLAERAVQQIGVPTRWREDAVAEYVLAAWVAGQQTDGVGNVQAYQCRRGRGAVIDFTRREQRQENLSPGSCAVGAIRVSIDKTIRLPDGEQVPMSETIEDRNMPQPDARMLEAERREAVDQAVEDLARVTQEVVRLAWLEGRTQVEMAEALGLSRQKVQRTLDYARVFLRERLEIFGDMYNAMRCGEK